MVRNLLLSITPKQDDVFRVITSVKQEMNKLKGENDNEYVLFNELFEIHLEYLSGNNKQFLTRLTMCIDKVEASSKLAVLYYTKLTLLAQQPDLCSRILNHLPKWEEDSMDWDNLLLVAQRRVLEHECQLAAKEVEKMLTHISQVSNENSLEGASLAFEYFKQRENCHHATLALLSAMEQAFPKGLDSNKIRDLIFECEQTLMNSPMLKKSDRLVAKKKSDAAKQAFNRRFTNVR